MSTAKDILNLIKEKDVKYVDVRFTDVRGKMQQSIQSGRRSDRRMSGESGGLRKRGTCWFRAGI